MRRWRIYFILAFIQMITRCHSAENPHRDGKESVTTTESITTPSSPTTQTQASTQVTPPPSKPPGTGPSSSLILNVVNNLGYYWYPLKSDKLCEADNLAGCTGGLACLVKNLSERKDIPLLSAGNTLVDSTAKTDFFKAMKFEPAVKALNILQSSGLQALVMGSDVFRYGGSSANAFAENVNKNVKMLACNLKSTTQEPAKEPFLPLWDIEPKNSASCGIRVIGFANADKMNQLRPENITVYNEIDNITSTIASKPRQKYLIVAMGEGTIELAKKISAIEDVDLVIMSGSNDTAGEPLQNVTENGRVKYILSKALPGFAQLTIQLSADCRIADGTTTTEKLYKESLSESECKIDDAEKKKSIDEAISAGVNKFKTYDKDLSVKLVSRLSSEDCDSRECTLGSTAADAVAQAAAAQNKVFPLDSRAVLLPAGIFKNNATLSEPVSQKALMDLLVDDEVFYNVNLTATQLKQILEKMLNETDVNFPQLSGFRLFVDIKEDYGQKVDILHILRNHLLFENVGFVENAEEYRVILPLNFLLRNGIDTLDSYPYSTTGVFLSEALSSFFQSQSSGGPFLPPPLGERITYVLPPTLGRCENLIAITVCYTFLAIITISSVLLLGYKIYSDRTAVHYVR